MIQIEDITKKFTKKTSVLENFTLNIEPGGIYGVVGFNGAGKTTLLKVLCGIYRPEKGKITIDGEPVYENEAIKRKFFMVQEEALFLPQATLKNMEKFYKGYYPDWNHNTYVSLAELFGLDLNKKINGFSKGMQRQASIIIALATHPDYLILDESFDGLDLAKRNLLRKILFAYLRIKGKNIIISSHNLRELEGLCHYVAMIKDAHLYLSTSVEELHDIRTKYKAGFSKDINTDALKNIGAYQIIGEGKDYTFLCDEAEGKIREELADTGLISLEKLPVTLEEVFLESAEEDTDYDFEEIFK